ncbi:MAG: hypothetical protein WC279_11735 [Sulfurimonas sp.]|jgi:hypothetical protein|uniref:hypothetical protein n=1 Tax=Sulfurimonas sp. TaxID=2022749 RepID=UPI003564BEA7
MPDNESLEIKILVIADWYGIEYEVIAEKIKIGNTFYWHYDDTDGIDRLLKCGQEDEITDN